MNDAALRNRLFEMRQWFRRQGDDAAGRRVLGRVVEQVLEYLRQSRAVALDMERLVRQLQEQ